MSEREETSQDLETDSQMAVEKEEAETAGVTTNQGLKRKSRVL